MRRAILATVTFTLLLVPWTTSGQVRVTAQNMWTNPRQPSGGEPPMIPPAQTSTPQTTLPQARTPKDDLEYRADLFMARKQFSDAAEMYRKALEIEPRNPVLLNKLGIAYHQQSMLEAAKRCYERATKVDRSFASSYNNLGTIQYQRKKYRKAISMYKKAIELRPDMPAVYSNLGYAYFAQKHYEDAMAAFRKALELDPTVFDPNRNTTGSLLQDRSVADKGMFYFFLAKSFAMMGNAERCAHYLKKAFDEGYKNVVAAKTDPAFAAVLKDSSVQEVLQQAQPQEPDPRPINPNPPGT